MEGQTDVSCVIELIGQNFLCKKFQMAVDFFHGSAVSKQPT